MDNKLFNVNGMSFYQLKKTIELILLDEYVEEGIKKRFGGSGIRGYRISQKKGIILYWNFDDKLEKKGVLPIENIITNEVLEKHNSTKELRKYKLEKLKDIKITIPINLLVISIWEWLKTININEFELCDWEGNIDHDGFNEKGFRVYVENWGHIKNEDDITIDHYTSFAVKPIYCWYGK